MNYNFKEWIEHLGKNETHRAFFSKLFEQLEELGFELETNHPEFAIEGGFRLSFIKSCRYVVCDRFAHFPCRGEEPGIMLLDEMAAWEATYNAWTPYGLVEDALNLLNPIEYDD